MPKGEAFFNPYRWVPVTKEAPALEPPHYHHRYVGLAGELECTLTALTPFLIGSSKQPGQFISSRRTKQLFIPATSLKGMIRSLVELVGNATIPFDGDKADEQHTLKHAASGKGRTWKLDVAARMFGYLKGGDVFAGLVRFSDATCEHSEKAPRVKVVVGQPRPERHKPFYLPDRAQRKFYHHHPGAKSLTPAPSSITQVREVSPLGPGSRFRFSVRFTNLRQEELALLLYALTLEEEVTVTLSKDALGPEASGSQTLRGPMRHKLGACKPAGGGSVQIEVVRMKVWDDVRTRYQGGQVQVHEWQGDDLCKEIERRTESIRKRRDPTMQALRAMLIYTSDDPRKPVQYPSYAWFAQDKGKGTPLKPTL
jgi:CRISPR/Cas system CSM-associated protein Csm3 (group 7 of RAMP superfamily)